MATENLCNATVTLIYCESGLRSIVGLTIILGLATGVGNLLVIASVYFFKSLRSVSNFFLVSLAAADFLVGTVIAPLYSLTAFKWPVLGSTVGQAYDFIVIFGLAASSFSLVAVTYDRHLAISLPLLYQSKMTLRSCCVIVITVWTCSLIVGIPNFITKNVRPRSMYFLLFVTVAFVFPLIYLVIVQIKILKAVKRQLEFFSSYTLGTRSSLKDTSKVAKDIQECTAFDDHFQLNENTGAKLCNQKRTMDCSGRQQITVDQSAQQESATNNRADNDNDTDENYHNSIADQNEMKARSFKEQEISIIIDSDKSAAIFFTKNKNADMKSKERRDIAIDDTNNPECFLSCTEDTESSSTFEDHQRQSKSTTEKRIQDVMAKSNNSDIISKINQTNIPNVRKTNVLRSREISTRTKQMLKHRKYSITMLIVIGCFAFCWIPNVVVIVIQALAQDICTVMKYEQIFYITIVISLGNSLLNPFIYCTRMEGFRTAFKKILKCKCRGSS